MDRYEMEDDIRARLGDDSEDVSDAALSAYLDEAQSSMVGWLWPFDGSKDWDDVPERLHPATCNIAVYLISKQGAEGETQHGENGTTRYYGSAHVPEAMFAGIARHAGVPM